MSKLVFPAVGAPYRGFIGEIRGWFNRIASYLQNSPGAAVAVRSQVGVLVQATGWTPTYPATQQLVSNTQAITGITMTGTAGSGKTGTFTVAGGVITAIAFT